MTNNYGKESRSNVENFVVFGTAFPEQTEKDKRAGRSDAGQFVPVWKQEARDENGRRRFHGAFTGGFSAGYFNTVGSKEGWEPTNYVSSRKSRNERKEARPEDFMDEEDLQDMAGSRKLVATEEFDIIGGTERELQARRTLQQQEQERGSGLGFMSTSLMDMFGPPKDSVGIRLLRKMGWRPGQGIGPRIIKKQLEQDDDDDEDDAFLGDATFAPRDTPIENYQPKRDTYGLGFDLSASVPEVAEMKRLRELARQKDLNGAEKDKKNRSAFGVSADGDAFGLGAFEEEDDDNVYRNDMSDYHSTLYDDEGGYTRDQLKRKRNQVEKDDGYSRNNKIKCSDGRPPLKGFHVSTQKQQIGNWFPPPKVPDDFTGKHIMKHTATAGTKISSDNMFSFEERGRALDEKPIEQRSVFDYIPKRSKDQLDRAVSWFIDMGKDKSKLSDFPTITKEVANLALRGFMPFGDNPKKQARYKSYLEDQAGRLTKDGEPNKTLPIPEGLTYESGMKELDEFAKAARIFRPISSMMSSRFTTASDTSKSEVMSFEGGLKTEEQYRKEKEEKEKLLPEPEKKQLSQEAEAAAMKMFGALTRTVKPFYPNRLVCKRFNVKNPHPDHDPLADNKTGKSQAGSKDALSKEAMDELLNQRLPLKITETNDPLSQAVIPKPSERTESDSNVTAPVTGIETTAAAAKDEEEEGEEGPPLDYERPSIDIFKAIFDTSDSEDDDEEEVEEKQETQVAVQSMEVDDDNDFIGPPVPPQPATADIPSTAEPTESFESFRPMFKRASERKEKNEQPLDIMSEEVVVQPFKPRHSSSKRRRVSISEDDEKDKEEQSRDREDRKHKSSSSSHRRKEKRSSSSRHKSRRDDSRDRHRHRRDDSRDRHRHRKDRKHKSSRKHDEEVFEGMWVEKEPAVPPPPNKKQKERMSAADMW